MLGLRLRHSVIRCTSQKRQLVVCQSFISKSSLGLALCAMTDAKNFYVSYLYDCDDPTEWQTIFLDKAHKAISKMTKKMRQRNGARLRVCKSCIEMEKINKVPASVAYHNNNFETLEYAEYLHYW